MITTTTISSSIRSTARSPGIPYNKSNRRAWKAALPALALASQLGAAFGALGYICFLSDVSVIKYAVRFVYVIVFSVGMEFVSRYEHMFLWHSNALWWIHASHHHVQSVKPGEGPQKSHSSQHKVAVGGVWEDNDIFPIVFASLAIVIMFWAFHSPSKILLVDVAFGSSVGISVYGTSYFIGHDFCAHERGGKEFANWLRANIPYMGECADLHSRYHHARRTGITDDQDPFGPPYGFWMAAQEVENLKQGKDYTPMPLWCKRMFQVALAGIGYACAEACMGLDAFALAQKLIL